MATDLLATFEEQAQTLRGVGVKKNEPLSSHTSMGVGGPARWFVEVENLDALRAVLGLLQSTRMRWMMLGGGSNTLFEDAGYAGVIVHLGKEFRAIQLGDSPDCVVAGGAATLSAIMNFAKRRGLAGMEFSAGIPGVLGGALAGNAGAGPGDICGITEWVETLDPMDPSAPVVIKRRGEFKYHYRFSELSGSVILRAGLRLHPDDPVKIEERIQQSLSKRMEQPVGDRSAGCMFKNPPGNFAGRLIDEAGLKGLRVGNVYVSDKHANFMINEGKGTAAEIKQLMAEVRRRVQEKTGIELEIEVRQPL